ncbi:hypothetical protein GCM10009798_24610 [Nocardioides panacihumi]|uniref:AMP-dependent synthetase/ligase domain-containing protein n=1 Tax=Nocardioides panacihumi TaxID=400774 RepID=A0ABP5CGC0_9ACTN
MKLVDCLDLGAALVPTSACLVTETATLSYAETQGLSRSVAASLTACGVGPGDTVGVLSANDPLALTCVFGASRADAAWALIDPADATVEELLQELSACSALLFRTADAELAQEVHLRMPLPHALVCLDGHVPGALGWGEFLVNGFTRTAVVPVGPSASSSGDADASEDRPVFLALGPLSEATADRWLPVLAQGGRIVMRTTPAVASEALLEA